MAARQIDLSLTFLHEEDANRFLALVRYLQWCGDIGHSGRVAVDADGDGRFKMWARVRTGDSVSVPENDYTDLKELVLFDEDEWKTLRGEYRDYQKKRGRRDTGGIEFSISMGN